MYKIVEKKWLTPIICYMDIEAKDLSNSAQPGQFLIVKTDEKGERIPLTICDYNREQGTVTIVFQVVGKSTQDMAKLEKGVYFSDVVGPLGQPSELIYLGEEELKNKKYIFIAGGVGTAPVYPQVKWMKEKGYDVDVIIGTKSKDTLVGPLGQPSELIYLGEEELKNKKYIFIAGGVGTAPVYPQVKWMKEKGCDVDVIIGTRSKDTLIFEEEMKAIAKNLYVCTDDGSYGKKGLVTDMLDDLLAEGKHYDHAVVIGPMIMMKFASKKCRENNIPNTVSLNPLMVDGTGMCGACRVTIGDKVKFACVDGPEFNGDDVNFDEAMRRQNMYKTEEGRNILKIEDGETHENPACPNHEPTFEPKKRVPVREQTNTVSLNPLMVDGTGMCGACRVTIGDKVKFACVDGPEFNGDDVNFDEAMRRQNMYKTEEGRNILKIEDGETHENPACPNHEPTFEPKKRVPVREQNPEIRNKNFDEVCYGYNLVEAQAEAARCLNCKNPLCTKGCLRNKNFDEVCYGYNLVEAQAEAARCLNCKNPLCTKGCPVSIDIPGFIQKIKEGDILGAAKIITKYSNLPAVCGRVCPQETQCEGKCILGVKGEPIAIGKLERFVGDWIIENKIDFEVEEKKDEKVAIIGGGPAGLTAAGDLATNGYQGTIFEARHKGGGVLSYGIPEFRLPKEKVVDKEVENLKQLGVEFKTDSVIGRTFTVDELLDEKGYSAVFIGSGAGLPRFMNIPGENYNGVKNIYS